MSEQVGRRCEIEQDHCGERERDDAMGAWHEFNDSWLFCHLSRRHGRGIIRAMTTPAPRIQILFFDGVDDLDPVGPLEILTAAGLPTRAVRPAGHPATIHTAHGLVIDVAGELDEDAQLVIVPGGGWRDEDGGVRDLARGPLPAQLAALHSQGTVLASVCTGAMLLAIAGLLKGDRR